MPARIARRPRAVRARATRRRPAAAPRKAAIKQPKRQPPSQSKRQSIPHHPHKLISDELATTNTLGIGTRVMQSNSPFLSAAINANWTAFAGNSMAFVLDPTSMKGTWPLFYADLSQAAVAIDGATTWGVPAQTTPSTDFEFVRTTGCLLTMKYAGPPLTMAGRCTVCPFTPPALSTDMNAYFIAMKSSPLAKTYSMSDLCKGVHITAKCLGDGARRYVVPVFSAPLSPYFVTPTFANTTYGGPTVSWENVAIIFENLAADASVNFSVRLYQEGIGKRGSLESATATPPNKQMGHTVAVLQKHAAASVAHVGAPALERLSDAPAGTPQNYGSTLFY